VLNTRPREQAAELSRLLRAAGFDVVEAPAIETVAAWDPAELQAVRDGLAASAYAWVVLASQNAGRGLLAELGTARVVCGAATAQALGLTPTLALVRFSAAAALEALRQRVQSGQRILVPRAAEGRDELVDGLRTLGLDVHAPTAYRTVAVDPTALIAAAAERSALSSGDSGGSPGPVASGRALAARMRDGEVWVVTACSPSAVQSLLHAVSGEFLLMTTLVCLGETTADAARQAGLRVASVAAETTMASLVEAVIAATRQPPAAPEEAGGPGPATVRQPSATPERNGSHDSTPARQPSSASERNGSHDSTPARQPSVTPKRNGGQDSPPVRREGARPVPSVREHEATRPAESARAVTPGAGREVPA